ncbi:hypothetical protein BCV70DRAFT_230954 [Testicularia cyperi]|uniref:Uncharacterized protein n=1 Tax=Testicularia cyperi TaxID=1882483 RepID=A0A317XRA9_9BASI|nr:hypothetical protein BCV70DRAFT_230954 [Testicularia cyperi]
MDAALLDEASANQSELATIRSGSRLTSSILADHGQSYSPASYNKSASFATCSETGCAPQCPAFAHQYACSGTRLKYCFFSSTGDTQTVLPQRLAASGQQVTFFCATSALPCCGCFTSLGFLLTVNYPMSCHLIGLSVHGCLFSSTVQDKVLRARPIQGCKQPQ